MDDPTVGLLQDGLRAERVAQIGGVGGLTSKQQLRHIQEGQAQAQGQGGWGMASSDGAGPTFSMFDTNKDGIVDQRDYLSQITGAGQKRPRPSARSAAEARSEVDVMGKVASDLAVSARFSRLDRERWREVNVFGAMVSPPKDNLVVWARGRRTSGKAEEAARFEKSLGLWSKLRVGDRMLRVSDEGGVWTLPERLVRYQIEYWMRRSSFFVKATLATKLHATLPTAVMSRCFPRLGAYVGAKYLAPTMNDEQMAQDEKDRTDVYVAYRRVRHHQRPTTDGRRPTSRQSTNTQDCTHHHQSPLGN